MFAAIMDHYASGEPLFADAAALAASDTAIHLDDSKVRGREEEGMFLSEVLTSFVSTRAVSDTAVHHIGSEVWELRAGHVP